MRFLLAVLVASAVPASAQSFLLSRTTGGQVAGKPVASRGVGAERKLVFATGGREVPVPFHEILALHGPPPKVTAPVGVYLAGGDELKGELAGGDESGDNFELRSMTLGTRPIPVDRLATLIFRARAPRATARDFTIDAGTGYEEALFLKARRGFDVAGGELERFGANGILFVPTGRRLRTFRYDKLTGMSMPGIRPEFVGGWLLVTASGDRLRVNLTDVSASALQFQTEFGAVSLPHSQVAALTMITSDRQFLSDMNPVRIAEAGSDANLDPAPLFEFRRDRTASGGMLATGRSPADGFLVVDGHTYGKGLGVHSRCHLTYRIPPGARFFHAKVAIDDEVKALRVKGDVDVRVRMGDKVLFEAKGLQRGQPAKSCGRLLVKPGGLLTLEVDFGKAMFLGDRLDWLSAVFLK